MAEHQNAPAGATTAAEGAPESAPHSSSSSVSLSERETRQQSEQSDLVAAVTAVVRDADRDFERVGGGSRHWVCECFLPTLNAAGLMVIRGIDSGDILCRHCNEELRFMDGAWCDRETHSTCLGSERRHEPSNATAARLQSERETLIAERDDARSELRTAQIWRQLAEPVVARCETAEAEIARLSSQLAGLRTATKPAYEILAALAESVEWELAPSIMALIRKTLPPMGAALAASQERDTTTEKQ